MRNLIFWKRKKREEKKGSLLYVLNSLNNRMRNSPIASFISRSAPITFHMYQQSNFGMISWSFVYNDTKSETVTHYFLCKSNECDPTTHKIWVNRIRILVDRNNNNNSNLQTQWKMCFPTSRIELRYLEVSSDEKFPLNHPPIYQH